MATRTKPAAAPATLDHSSGEDITPQPFVLTASLADLARERRNRVQDFALTATSEALGREVIAKVRRVDLNSVDAILALPEQLTRQVLEMQAAVTKAQEQGVTNPDGTVNADTAMQAMQMVRETRDLYCVAGFVEPALIADEARRTRDDQIVVDLIDPTDRRRFFEWCSGQETEARATVARFPDGPGEDVDAGRSGGGDQSSAERPVAVAGGGAE